MFGKWMRAREIAHTKKDDNRVVRPFQWGLEFISDRVNGDDPRNLLRAYSERAMADSDLKGRPWYSKSSSRTVTQCSTP